MLKNRSKKGKKKTTFKRNNVEASKKHVVHLHTNWRKIQACKWTKLQNKIRKHHQLLHTQNKNKNDIKENNIRNLNNNKERINNKEYQKKLINFNFYDLACKIAKWQCI